MTCLPVHMYLLHFGLYATEKEKIFGNWTGTVRECTIVEGPLYTEDHSVTYPFDYLYESFEFVHYRFLVGV